MSNDPKADNKADNKLEAKAARHTHQAVHAIQYRDADGNFVEIAPKTQFSPNAVKELGSVADLERKGAIRKLTKDDVASEVVKS